MCVENFLVDGLQDMHIPFEKDDISSPQMLQFVSFEKVKAAAWFYPQTCLKAFFPKGLYNYLVKWKEDSSNFGPENNQEFFASFLSMEKCKIILNLAYCSFCCDIFRAGRYVFTDTI